MIGLIKRIHKKIPPHIRGFYMSLLQNFFYGLQKNANFIYPPVIIFEGCEKNTQIPLAFAYVGFQPLISHYWVNAILSGGFKKHSVGRCFFWEVRSFLKKRSFDCSFILMEHNGFTLHSLSSHQGFRTPYWVSMEIDISKEIERMFGRQKSDIERKIRKNGLTYIMTRDQKSFDDFYYNMFLPYIKDRHRGAALLDTYDTILSAFSKGELILIKMEDQIIGGGMVEFNGKEVKFRRLGVRDAKWEYVQQGVIVAMYYFLAGEMKKRGYTSLHIGGTRPLLSDGVTKYKMSLNAQVITENKHSCLWLTFLKNSDGLRKFLINNPFIFYTKKRVPCRAVFLDAVQGSSSDNLKPVLASSECEGLKETHLFVFGDKMPFLHKSNTLSDPSLFIRSMEDMFK